MKGRIKERRQTAGKKKRKIKQGEEKGKRQEALERHPE